MGCTLEEIRHLKDAGYLIHSQKVNGKLYYYSPMGNELCSMFISGISKEKQEVRYVELSDVHFGSVFCDVNGIKAVLQRAVDEGYKDVHFSGDLVDGIHIYKSHHLFLKYFTAQDQADYAAEVLGKFPLRFIACAGNHDRSWETQGSPSPLTLVSNQLNNFIYLPGTAADLIIAGVACRICHLDGGRAYARSYPGQTYVRNLLDSQGEHVWVRGNKYRMRFLQLGHLHFEMLYESAGIFITHPGNFQFANDYCTRRGLVGSQGCRFTKAIIENGKVLEHTTTFIKPR